MHMKWDSEIASLTPTSPRSPRRPLYYVQSPSQHDGADKMSFQSSPMASPPHYHCSPIHHSRESSTSRFSVSLKQHSSRNPPKINNTASSSSSKYWKRINQHQVDKEEEDGQVSEKETVSLPRLYFLCLLLWFIILFTLFSLILWGISKSYKPKITMKSIAFESFNIQAGTDITGVPTKMLSIRATVKLSYTNSASFFGLHVTSTPLDLYYYQLKIATGNMKMFYQDRKSKRLFSALVQGTQVPLYGGGSTLSSSTEDPMKIPLNLTLTVRSRAFVLGKLVKPKFYRRIRCSLLLDKRKIGKPFDLKDSCKYLE